MLHSCRYGSSKSGRSARAEIAGEEDAFSSFPCYEVWSYRRQHLFQTILHRRLGAAQRPYRVPIWNPGTQGLDSPPIGNPDVCIHGRLTILKASNCSPDIFAFG